MHFSTLVMCNHTIGFAQHFNVDREREIETRTVLYPSTDGGWPFLFISWASFFFFLSALSKNECLEILSRVPMVCLGGNWTDLEQWKGREKVLESNSPKSQRWGWLPHVSHVTRSCYLFFFFFDYFGYGICRVFIVGKSLLCN